MQRNVHEPLQTARPAGVDRWHAGHRRRSQAPVVDEPEPAGTFGHEEIAVWKERQRPRLFEVAREHYHAKVPFLGRFDLQRVTGEFRCRPAQRCGRVAALQFMRGKRLSRVLLSECGRRAERDDQQRWC